MPYKEITSALKKSIQKSIYKNLSHPVHPHFPSINLLIIQLTKNTFPSIFPES